MTQKYAGKMKLIVSALTLCLVAQQSLFLQVGAGQITGIAPGYDQNGNKVYNIDPSVLHGDIGFRLYNNFKLDKGEIANLIFKYGEQNISKFVNLVDNTISINGLVNTMKDGNFFNGHAIFVSPNGMVVGASGVLNVGSLTVLTPNQNEFDKFKSDFDINGNLDPLYSEGTGKVTINGKVIARDMVDIRAAAVDISNNAAIMAGVKTLDNITTEAQANALFNNLVNTDNMSTGNSFASENGSIKITSYSGDGGVNIAAGSALKNFGKGNIEVSSKGAKGINIDGELKNPNGSTILTTETGSITVNGNVLNKGGDLIASSANGIELSVDGSMKNQDGNTVLTNRGTKGMRLNGTVQNRNGNLTLDNSAEGGITINGAPISNTNGNLTMKNTGANGITINGTVTNTNGNSEYINEAGNFAINGVVSNQGNLMKFTNSGTGIKLAEGARIDSDGELQMTNTGEQGINIEGLMTVKNGTATISNSGARGITLASKGKITNETHSVTLSNEGEKGINIKGLVNAKGVTLNSKNSNIVIGDDSDNDKYITSAGDININIENGSLLNAGYDKTLLTTTNGGNLNIDVTDGSIGEEVGNKNNVSTGVDPKSRDFTKSINVNIDGAITAKALQKNNKENDLTINLTSKNSDMKIDHIKADGKVILTAADFDKDGNGYSILNASTDNTKANVEGKGISMIASNSIGSADKKLTFNQTAGKFNKDGFNLENLEYSPNAAYGVDMLAINDINVKGQDDAYDTNVTTMISRKGSINAEFSGNTYINEVTADKAINITTRGAEMVIDNLGLVPNTPVDYFGENGMIAPDEVNLKVLDINPNTRVDNEVIDGVNHWANSHLIVRNGRVDKDAKIVLTGDDVYAGGYHFYMGKERNEDGKTYWVKDDRTAMVDMNGDAPTIRVNSVRKEDVIAIGRKEEERNYYTGGSIQEDKPWYGDDDDDDDHLIVPEPEEPTPPGDDDDDDDDDGPPPGDDDDDDDDDDGPPPGDDDDDDDDDGPGPGPGPEPEPNPNGPSMDDAKRTFKQKEISENLATIDKRQYIRFQVEGNRNPVEFQSNEKISSLIDISRGGVAVNHNNNLKVGDIVPVKITYGNLNIDTDVKVVTASTKRAGAEFVNLDKATANKLLYLNLLLEDQNSTISFGKSNSRNQ